MQKSKPFVLVLIMLLLVWPLQAQKKAPPRKPVSKKPTSAPNAAKPEEPEEEDLLPPPKPKPPLKPEDPFGRIVLLPLDDRPAAGQFAQMIGAIADHEVIMPPKEMLGRFTTAGDTKKIQDWLSIVDYSKIDAIVISVDMLDRKSVV